MYNEIQFGELEQPELRQAARPDQNRHFAVVPCGSPNEQDLAIYIDIDVLCELEMHAASNTNVELGGVLLGGQFVDEQANPFVVISDSLRAEHYEATRGSFKFTHDTWSQITRQREQFPDDLQMVGWYHTHPSWGVFLSGMDTFICENFFRQPLDLALVIDPCRSDRGFFQWTDRSERPLTRTSGFYLIGSRFRQTEIELVADQLESGIKMAPDSRFGSTPGRSPDSVVHIVEPQAGWLGVAVLGMLAIQFLLVALIAWRMLGREPQSTATAGPATASAPDHLAQQQQMLDQIIGQLDVAPDGVVKTLQQQRRENQALRSANVGLLARVDQLKQTSHATDVERQTLERKLEQTQATVARLTRENAAYRDSLAELAPKATKTPEPKSKDVDAKNEPAEAFGTWIWSWRWYVGAGLAVVLGLVASALVYLPHGPSTQTTESEDRGDGE